MSFEDAKKFLDHAILDSVFRFKYMLSWRVDDIMNLADHLGLSFTMEELDAASYESTKNLKIRNRKEPEERTVKLMDDIFYIFKDHEERYENLVREWLQVTPDNESSNRKISELSEVEFYYFAGKSPLLLVLNNTLSFILKSDVGTWCKAEDFLDTMHSNNPDYFQARVNYLPNRFDQPPHPDLLVWCFDEDDLNQRLSEMIDYIEKRPHPLRTVVFLATHWNWDSWTSSRQKIKALSIVGTRFTFIFFSRSGAVAF